MRLLHLGTLLLLLAAAPAFSEADATKMSQRTSLSYGNGGCGKLEGGVALPCEGANFEAFTREACAKSRNFLHPLVVKTTVAAYARLEAEGVERRWQYGDLGSPVGGKFKPHRTHQNGLSADFFVPVRNKAGEPELLPVSKKNLWGYGLEFSRAGQLREWQIDWKAMAQHLLALEEAGKEHGVRIERIILTPAFHAKLLKHAPEIAPLLPRFMKKEAWVRHDEHYHVDFEIPGALRRPLKCR